MKIPRPAPIFMKKIYGIFTHGHDGTILGLSENSYSFSWESKTVRVWNLKYATYYYNRYIRRERGFVTGFNKFFIARLRAKSCPVEIDWNLKDESNFHIRNAKFHLKQKV